MKVGKFKDGGRVIFLENDQETADVKQAIYIEMKAADQQGKKALADRLEKLFEAL